MTLKSAAQIRRLKRRAIDRGAVYVPTESASDSKDGNAPSDAEVKKIDDSPEAKKLNIATRLQNELESIMENKELKAKERRSNKRKAEAIALEESGCSDIDELLKLLPEKKNVKDEKSSNTEKKISTYPYILFLGQLSYETTKDQILEHFQNTLKQDTSISLKSLTASAFQVRLLTDSKTKKSKGMAFFQTYDPKIMHSCLQLHHTYLNGRRINVEKSTGGKKDSAERQKKLSSFRDEQQKHVSESVDSIFKELVKDGQLEHKEFDDSAIQVCKRHAPSVVHEALLEYIETKEHKKFKIRNKSSYFITILEKVGKGEEDNDESTKFNPKRKQAKSDSDNRNGKKRPKR